MIDDETHRLLNDLLIIAVFASPISHSPSLKIVLQLSFGKPLYSLFKFSKETDPIFPFKKEHRTKVYLKS